VGHCQKTWYQVPAPIQRIKIMSILKVLSDGVVLLGGLNPVAAAVEVGIEVEKAAESGIVDFQQL
jgi:repressor of nif and glnA expression